jgi:hypothetical protein
MSVTNKNVYKQKDGIVVTPLEDFFLIFPNHTDEINKPYLCKLNHSAYTMFACIDGKSTVADIVKLLEEKYDAPNEVIESDFLDLLVHLEEKNIIAKLI